MEGLKTDTKSNVPWGCELASVLDPPIGPPLRPTEDEPWAGACGGAGVKGEVKNPADVSGPFAVLYLSLSRFNDSSM